MVTALLACGLVAWLCHGVAVALPPPPADSPGTTLTRLAFASCNHHDDPQPFWDDIAARRPDLFVWLGDIVYADRKVIWKWRIPADEAHLAALFDAQAAVPEYARFTAAVPVTGVYDDHDAGQNDADKRFDLLRDGVSARLLLDFLHEQPESERRQRGRGVYTYYMFGKAPRRARLILLDNRTFRDPYDGAEQDMLGGEQWEWLERVLTTTTADVTFIGMGLQFLSRGDPWITESWSKLPQSQAKLISLLAATNTSGVVLLSGDMHVAEVHRATCGALGYPLYDLTASGMTHSWGGPIVGTGWWALIPGTTRVADGLYQGKHWGEVVIDWDGHDHDGVPTLLYNVHDATAGSKGKVVMAHRIPLASLASPVGAGLAGLARIDCHHPPAGLSANVTSSAWQHADPGSGTQPADAVAVAQWLHACTPNLAPTPDSMGYPLSINGQPWQRAGDPSGWASAQGDLAAAVAQCAHAELTQGYTEACDRVIRTCDPKITYGDTAFYYGGHAALLSAVWGVIGGGAVLAWYAMAGKHNLLGGRILWSAIGVAIVAAIFGFIRVAI